MQSSYEFNGTGKEARLARQQKFNYLLQLQITTDCCMYNSTGTSLFPSQQSKSSIITDLKKKKKTSVVVNKREVIVKFICSVVKIAQMYKFTAIHSKKLKIRGKTIQDIMSLFLSDSFNIKSQSHSYTKHFHGHSTKYVTSKNQKSATCLQIVRHFSVNSSDSSFTVLNQVCWSWEKLYSEVDTTTDTVILGKGKNLYANR